MKWIIVVAFLAQPGDNTQELWAFMEYPFPDVIACKAFAGMNYGLASNLASQKLGRPTEEIENIFCAPAQELLEMKNGQSI